MSKAKKRVARRPRVRDERQLDPRLAAARRISPDGDKTDDWAVIVSPVDMEDGERLMWHPPQPVAFNLIQAKQHRDRGVRQRRAIIGNLIRRDDGHLQPANDRATLDCLADLAAAVLFAFTAVESLANHAIDMLPDDTVVDDRRGRQLAKSELASLGIDDKLKRVVPLLDSGAKVAGTAAWERYRELRFLRDELLHVKRRGYDPDPSVRTAYDRLMMGEGDRCVENAQAVVEGAFPGFLPEGVTAALA